MYSLSSFKITNFIFQKHRSFIQQEDEKGVQSFGSVAEFCQYYDDIMMMQ
jgi:hypothetical protein